MVRVRSPGDPKRATPSRRTALYLDAVSAPVGAGRFSVLGLFSDLSLASVDTARYAVSRCTTYHMARYGVIGYL